MTTGNALFADAENNESGSGEDLGGTGGSERGSTAYDVSVLKLDLTAPADANCLKLDFAFYSEEYPEYVGSSYNDTFIAELDETTWTTSGSQISAPNNFAFDPQGNVVSVNSTGATSMNEINAGGTTYDGGTVLLEAATQITPGDHTLYLSILDQGDQILDSAAFVDNIRFQNVTSPEGECKPGAQPAEKTPLILVPGISGSQIVNSESEAELWPRSQDLYESLKDEFLFDLKLDENGNDIPGQEARAGEILKRADIQIIPFAGFGPVYSRDIYDTTIKDLEARGYKLNEDLFVFPYDWRKDIRSTTGGNLENDPNKTLLQFIDHVREQTKQPGEEPPQVDIMAHTGRAGDLSGSSGSRKRGRYTQGAYPRHASARRYEGPGNPSIPNALLH